MFHALLMPFGLLASDTAATANAPVLAELFTSQSCYSCPPAQDLFARLAARPGVVSLEWHVDYWDDLNYGRHGRWKDPYSSSEFTARQRTYNQRIRGTRSVYTPQAVIGGTTEAVGSRRPDVVRLIDGAAPGTARLAARAEEGAIRIAAEAARPATLWVAYFDRQTRTDVPRGENHGKTLNSRHVVLRHETLGTVEAGVLLTQEIAPPRDGQGCAIVLQVPDQGQVLAARYCPG